ncbi:unnamed protein product [Heterosigma akashiwo]
MRVSARIARMRSLLLRRRRRLSAWPPMLSAPRTQTAVTLTATMRVSARIARMRSSLLPRRRRLSAWLPMLSVLRTQTAVTQTATMREYARIGRICGCSTLIATLERSSGTTRRRRSLAGPNLKESKPDTFLFSTFQLETCGVLLAPHF